MNFLFQGVNYLTLLDRSLIYFGERSSEQPGHLFTQPVALHEPALGTQRPRRQPPNMSAVAGKPAVPSRCRDFSV
jgi:hypothetical protein